MHAGMTDWDKKLNMTFSPICSLKDTVVYKQKNT